MKQARSHLQCCIGHPKKPASSDRAETHPSVRPIFAGSPLQQKQQQMAKTWKTYFGEAPEANSSDDDDYHEGKPNGYTR